jgi:hypothetical protein
LSIFDIGDEKISIMGWKVVFIRAKLKVVFFRVFLGGQKTAFRESPLLDEILRMMSRTENFKSLYVSSSTFKSLTSVAAFWGLSGFPSECLEWKLK